MKAKIENMVADSINGNPIMIKFRGKDMEIPRPTLGTLIEASKYIAKLPEFDVKTEANAAVQQTLSIAKDCDKIPEILAILMLGKKDMRRAIRIFGMTVYKVDRVKKLAAEIENMTSQEIAEILVAIFSAMDCGFFLGIITSLQGINMLKKTKNETTAFGQPSQVS